MTNSSLPVNLVLPVVENPALTPASFVMTFQLTSGCMSWLAHLLIRT